MNQKFHKRIILPTVLLIVGLFLLITSLILAVAVFTMPKLPDLTEMINYQPNMPIKIYSQDNVLIGQYGIEQRTFTKIEDFPDTLKYAVLAAEDKRFYIHNGVDFIGVIRAMISNLITKKSGQGASTITQQIAKNFYLSSEKTYKRKFYEVLLALKVEMNLSKDKILELYLNQIYLGRQVYGFTAASKVYFNKPVAHLTVAEAAMLAGLPKAPSTLNPIINPKRAKQRQHYVLINMLREKWITQDQYNEAVRQHLVYPSRHDVYQVDPDSLYVAEMVRKQLHDQYGESIYRSGYQVYTTVTTKQQKAATQALRTALLNNNPNNTFMGAEAFHPLSNIPPKKLIAIALSYLTTHHKVQGQIPAIVIESDSKKVKVLVKGYNDPIMLTGISLHFIARAINNKNMGQKQVTVGSVIRLYKNKNGKWAITQLPKLEGGIISLDTKTGAIQAVVGGFDFFVNSFNRATQAHRQPGSTFKPFVYSGAIDRGYMTDTIIDDSPIHFGKYVPHNVGDGYAGPITLREALYRSNNVVSVKILNSIGINYAHQYVQRFGFSGQNIPKGLSMVLGSGQTTPLEMARAYAVFANGGFLIEPYIIDRIYNSQGQLIARTIPLTAEVNAPKVIDSENAFIMYKLLQDVIQYGTAKSAQAVGRNDVGGKTGTTNKQKDAWFVGFNKRIVTAVYIGFDHPKEMGLVGYGANVALPIWVDYMKTALKGMPVEQPRQPKNVTNNDGFYSVKGKHAESIKLEKSESPSPNKNQPDSSFDFLF